MITHDCSETRTTQIHLEVFREIWYSLYNAQIFWLCEIAEAWHSFFEVCRRVGEKSGWSGSSLTECFLSMQVCFSKHIKEMFEIDLCVTPDIRLTRSDKQASDLLSALFRGIKAATTNNEIKTCSDMLSGLSWVMLTDFTLLDPFFVSLLLFNAPFSQSDVGFLCLFKQCSVTCGVGVQNRDVYCRLKGTGRVREDLCDGQQRPATVRPCQTAECTHYTWVAGEWEQVSTRLSLSCPIYNLPPTLLCSQSPSVRQMNRCLTILLRFLLAEISVLSLHH